LTHFANFGSGLFFGGHRVFIMASLLSVVIFVLLFPSPAIFQALSCDSCRRWRSDEF